MSSPAITLYQRARRLTFLRALDVRDFRLMWLVETVSLLGDQFYVVALAWLTLQLTGSGSRTVRAID